RIASACRLLYAMRAEYTWHALSRHVADNNGLHDSLADRIMLSEPRLFAELRLHSVGAPLVTHLLLAANRSNRNDLPVEWWGFIARESSVNAVDERGATPLHCAAESGMVDCVRMLLDRGADVNARSKAGVHQGRWSGGY
ncbi:MAG: ankyrin repeat domain-containing protein, partial [Hydrogenophaga sp.]|uniref:ankyrin repeat domain-containing protein n=1 Tax=Hydrogenophaga sp. TaxID=1904254 RepID=UPI002613D001